MIQKLKYYVVLLKYHKINLSNEVKTTINVKKNKNKIMNENIHKGMTLAACIWYESSTKSGNKYENRSFT